MRSLNELTNELLKRFERELEMMTYVDDSDMCERFIDSTAKKIVADEKGLEYDEDLSEFEDLIGDLIDETASIINLKHKKASVRLRNREYLFYYLGKEGMRNYISFFDFSNAQIDKIIKNNVNYH